MISTKKAGLPGLFLWCFALAGCMEPSTSDFQKELAAQPSATAVLQAHCDRLRPGTTIQAIVLPVEREDTISPDIRSILAVGPDEPIGVRHVRLQCGTLLLSEAWNWYVPSRLTPEMVHILTTTHIPFGRAVAALHFRREALQTSSTNLPSGTILRNRAVLRRASDDAPISLVEENYQEAVLK
ncbi:hypothetical protein A0U90_01410 [Kozakia baliensis]|nr:hypothetical protein A0U90_01410 [Kozakia baliensis]